MAVPPLVLIGAGGFARETAEAVRAVNDVAPAWDLRGFVDDDPVLAGVEVDGLPVLGPLEAVRDMPEARVVVCTGHPGNYFSRRRIVDRLGLGPDRYATVVHPAAVLARSTDVGPGSVVLAATVTTASVRIGAHVAVMPSVVLTHDDVVGDFATLGAGARLAGRVTVADGAYIGAGALVRENLSVGRWALVGMGAVVTADVPSGEVWAGVPARFLRPVALPPDLMPQTARPGVGQGPHAREEGGPAPCPNGAVGAPPGAAKPQTARPGVGQGPHAREEGGPAPCPNGAAGAPPGAAKPQTARPV